jgi:hypothetical protein
MVRHTGEAFINVESVTVASVFSLKPSGVKRSGFDTPQADRFPGKDDVSFGQDIFDIAVTEVEAIVEPDGIGNDIGWGAPCGIRWRL